MKFSIRDLFSKCDHIPVNLVTFTEEILNGTLHFLRSVDYFRVLIDWVLIFEITTTQKCFLRIWSHLLRKSLTENFIFCAVNI